VPRLRIEPGRDLVENNEIGVVYQGECDEEALLLAAGEVAEGRVALAGQSPAAQEGVVVGRHRIEGGKQIDSLADGESVGEPSVLQLRTDPAIERRPGGLPWIHAEHPYGARVRLTQAESALYGRRFPSAVRADEAEDFAFLDL